MKRFVKKKSCIYDVSSCSTVGRSETGLERRNALPFGLGSVESTTMVQKIVADDIKGMRYYSDQLLYSVLVDCKTVFHYISKIIINRIEQ